MLPGIASQSVNRAVAILPWSRNILEKEQKSHRTLQAQLRPASLPNTKSVLTGFRVWFPVGLLKRLEWLVTFKSGRAEPFGGQCCWSWVLPSFPLPVSFLRIPSSWNILQVLKANCLFFQEIEVFKKWSEKPTEVNASDEISHPVHGSEVTSRLFLHLHFLFPGIERVLHP